MQLHIYTRPPTPIRAEHPKPRIRPGHDLIAVAAPTNPFRSPPHVTQEVYDDAGQLDDEVAAGSGGGVTSGQTLERATGLTRSSPMMPQALSVST